MNRNREKYKVFVEILDDYRRAGIIREKESEDMGIEYFFNKGMYNYDPHRIEKSIVISNYYEYLSNGIVQQKWATIFERTRLFQVLNISSKIKIIVNGIRNEVETQFFYMYLLGLCSIFENNTKNIKAM
jgi:hypothetical protein